MGVMILEYFIFLVIMITLLWINKALRKTFFTVSNYLIVTFSVITGVQVIACLLLKYKIATMEYWIILTAFIIIALLTDFTASRFARRLTFHDVKLKCQRESILMKKHEKRFNVICVMAAMYSIIHFIHLAGRFPNMYYVVQEQFQNQYSAGLNFYVRLFMMIAAAYYLGCSKISKKNILLGLFCLIPNILTFVKGIVFIPCLASILLRLKNGDIKITLKAGIIIVFVGIMVFFGVYLFEMGVYDPDILFNIDTYQYIGSKLIDYLIAGVQSFSQNISTDNVHLFRHLDNVTFAPFINFMAKFGLGKSIDTVNTVWQTFGFSSIRDTSITSNVNTYIGTLYLYNGVIIGNLLNILWVFIASFMDEIFSKRKDVFTALSALFCAAFSLGWFEYYFVHTFWVYLIAIAILVSAVLKIRIISKK